MLGLAPELLFLGGESGTTLARKGQHLFMMTQGPHPRSKKSKRSSCFVSNRHDPNLEKYKSY